MAGEGAVGAGAGAEENNETFLVTNKVCRPRKTFAQANLFYLNDP